MRILIIGDVVGRPGRRAVASLLPGLRQQYNLDLVIANAENAAGGAGLTPETAEELLQGVDVLTTGNHVWNYKEMASYLGGDRPVLRPLNYPPAVPGRGYLIKDNALVVNLVGRVFMGHFDCPFRAMDELLERLSPKPPVILVDFHAEATSEKVALGRYLDGRVSVVVGTHTHVGTIDAAILRGGTAFITDVGMVGPADSIIGADVDEVLYRFLTLMPGRMPPGKGPVIFNSVLVEVDDGGRAVSIVRLDQEFTETIDESRPSPA
ncbi:MAG TPA: YmdB family metallophosphoesterase [Dehalococcoidia bacterium]|nr:YmdB family metallophosphoesterase [Dehalococcoidia bacterium]